MPERMKVVTNQQIVEFVCDMIRPHQHIAISAKFAEAQERTKQSEVVVVPKKQLPGRSDHFFNLAEV